MAFRETVKSMRAYFVVVGVLGGLSDLNTLGNADGNAIVIAFGALGLAMAAGFLYCGARLPTLLKDTPGVVRTILYITLGLSAASGGLLVLAEVSESGPWIGVAIGAAVALYLLSNVKRLSEELQAKVEPEVFD